MPANHVILIKSKINMVIALTWSNAPWGHSKAIATQKQKIEHGVTGKKISHTIKGNLVLKRSLQSAWRSISARFAACSMNTKARRQQVRALLCYVLKVKRYEWSTAAKNLPFVTRSSTFAANCSNSKANFMLLTMRLQSFVLKPKPTLSGTSIASKL